MSKIINEPLSGANCYATLSGALEYFDSRLYSDTFTTATSGMQESALITATNEIDNLYTFDGYETYSGQTLDFPRTGIVDCDARYISCSPCGTGVGYIDSESIPPEVVEATYEQALFMLNQNVEGDVTQLNKGIKKAVVDKLSVEFRDNAKSTIDRASDKVKNLLRCFGKIIGSGWHRVIRY